MLDYTFICPHCGEESTIVERAHVLRDTDMIGFNYYNSLDKHDPEFSVWEEDVEDFSEPSYSDYICSSCEEILDVTYEQLYDYVKTHGSIGEEAHAKS